MGGGSKPIREKTESLSRGFSSLGPNSDPPKIMRLVRFQKIEELRALIKESDKKRELVQSSDIRSDTPLHWACANKGTEENLAIIRLLIEHGANLRAKNIHGNTPVDNALENGDSKVQKLIEAYNY